MKDKHPHLYFIIVVLILFPLILFSEFLAQFLLSKFYSPLDSGGLINKIAFLSAGITSAFLTIAIFRKFIDKKDFKSMGFDFRNRLFDLLLGLAVGTILISIGFIVLVIFGYLEVISFNFDANWLIGYIVLMALVALHEEVLLRGYLLNSFMNVSNKYVSLVISSLIFAALHLLNPNISIIPIVNLFLAGIFLGISYIHSKNLWFPMSLHFSWNFIQGPILGFQVSGQEVHPLISHQISGNTLITGGEFGFEGSLIATILILTSIVALDWFFKRNEELKKKITIGFSENELIVTED